MLDKVRWLYEHGAFVGHILSYLSFWGRWVRSGLQTVVGVRDRSAFEGLGGASRCRDRTRP
ncbi:hypothetical protein BJP34_16865 [Moorena producens PAL-8-15-08-1]|uniref:Uncharacterized protein n=1 Tax=Moorena producens PAL-8-15-08-1 TaxID=1458985 RepID=A0A1D8TTH1_9CYAN|nr:hypothetical protein BJP34_16865 [Moorena producens PAL-8-15-08-1]